MPKSEPKILWYRWDAQGESDNSLTADDLGKVLTLGRQHPEATLFEVEDGSDFFDVLAQGMTEEEIKVELKRLTDQ